MKIIENEAQPNAVGEFQARIVYGEGGEQGQEDLNADTFWLIDDLDSGYTLEIAGSDSASKYWVVVAVKAGRSEVARDVEVYGTSNFRGSRSGVHPHLSTVKGTLKGFVNTKEFARCESFEFSGQSDTLQRFSVTGSFDVSVQH